MPKFKFQALTKQEIFNRIYKHEMTQKEQSITTNDSLLCMYRYITKDNKTLKCYIGALIEDDEYNLFMEGRSISNLLINSDDMVSFFADLQRIHDYEGVHESRVYMLNEFAAECNLTIPAES